MLPFFGNYLYVKNLRHWLFSSRDIDDQKILKSDGMRVDFSQFESLCNACRKDTFLSLEVN